MPKNNCDFKPILTVARDGRVIGGDIFETLHKIEVGRRKELESQKIGQNQKIRFSATEKVINL